MALNRELEFAKEVCLPVPEGTKSGDFLVIGQIPCVALIDRNKEGEASVDMGGAYRLSVVGKNKAGNKAIAVGDIIYIKGGVLGVNNEEGVRFGYALDPVVSGATTVIRVKIGY